MDEAGFFHKIPRFDDSRLAEIFGREVLGFLLHKQLLSPEWAARLLSWRHTGFNVHSRVRARIKTEAERVGMYMIRPLLSLERLSLDEREGRIGYRYGKETKETERLDYLEFILPGGRSLADFGAFRVVGGLPPALRSLELYLISLPAGIYTLSRWTEGLATSKRLARQAQPKNKFLYFQSNGGSMSGGVSRCRNED